VLDRAAEIALRRRLLGVPPWCAGPLSYDGDELVVKGWALVPIGESMDDYGIAVNGKLVLSRSWGTHRPDIERIFWFWPGAALSGFEVTYRVPAAELFDSGSADIQFVSKKTLAPVNASHGSYLPDLRSSVLPMPPPDSRLRVQGTADEGVFYVEGFSAFLKITRALTKHSGRRADEFGQTLDWGCGCGRLARYWYGARRVRLTGIDIDGGNIAWCQRNLTFGRFQTVNLRPPTNLPPSRFRHVIGMSVMTHLSESDQLQWLDELARITRPDGLVALTVHGSPSMARSEMSHTLLDDWLERGFLDAGMNSDLIGAIDDPSFYRNSFHSRSYVATAWSQHFEIIEYIEGYVGNHHDLVILRRRRDKSRVGRLRERLQFELATGRRRLRLRR
jgi:SAM-dependent methyltransferase